jgi:AcrR family transcriptional regulator
VQRQRIAPPGHVLPPTEIRQQLRGAKAMRINRPSMYAAFGNKVQLYCKTLERYSKSRNEHLNEFSAAPTARESVFLALSHTIVPKENRKEPNSVAAVPLTACRQGA